MAKAQKRRVEGGRVTPKGTQPQSTKTPATVDTSNVGKVSPPWVTVLLFAFLALGVLIIFFNYVGWLPGGVNNWYLLAGLGCVLGGIVTATQLH